MSVTQNLIAAPADSFSSERLVALVRRLHSGGWSADECFLESPGRRNQQPLRIDDLLGELPSLLKDDVSLTWQCMVPNRLPLGITLAANDESWTITVESTLDYRTFDGTYNLKLSETPLLCACGEVLRYERVPIFIDQDRFFHRCPFCNTLPDLVKRTASLQGSDLAWKDVPEPFTRFRLCVELSAVEDDELWAAALSPEFKKLCEEELRCHLSEIHLVS